MVLRLALLAWLGCLATAGPVAWDDSKCSQQCNEGSKYQYSPQTSYIYSYESSNELQADGTSDLNIRMKATVELTVISKCEMVLQLSGITMQHGQLQEASSPFIEQLQRNPLPFSWNDGKIDHVCPNPDDSDDVNNIKKAILSSLQNTMRSFEYDAFDTETDILGDCDTEYKIKSQDIDKSVILKNKNIQTCINHLKGHTLLIATFYESAAHRQHLPLLSGESLSCLQTINNGIVEEVTCGEKAAFKPLSDYGYVVQATGKTRLKKLSSAAASRIMYRAPGKESLRFKHQTVTRKDDSLEANARDILKHICDTSSDLISKEAATYIHQLVYTIRRLSEQSLENIYASLKNKELCTSGKTLTIYLDALKAASSGGSIGLLSKLVIRGEIPKLDALLWMTFMPFTSYVEEESISAAAPLLRKDVANRQAILGVSAMAYKYCSSNPNCETSKGVQDVSSSLKQFLGDKCKTSNIAEETQVLTALKGFGNLGYIGDSTDGLFECATSPENKIHLRIAAIEAFRRSPCSENIISKLLAIYKNKNDVDELRIAALISLSKCVTSEIIRNVLEVYSSETSKQVEVFTYSYLDNLRTSSDPTKTKLLRSILTMKLKTPHSTDITKFSRNFEWSFFSDVLNLGHGIGGNVIHSSNSFLPKSGNLGLKVDIFGNQLNAFEVGGRVEDMEYVLEHLFGPRGLLKNVKVADLLPFTFQNGTRRKRSADAYKTKIENLSERYGYKRDKTPHGSAFFRVLGHEIGVIYLNKESLTRVGRLDINDVLKYLASLRDINASKNLLFLDVSMLFPSVTGRGYKLAVNGSFTAGLSAQGKIDIQQPHLRFPRADIDGRFQPSFLSEESASFTIHSEDYEPGVRAVAALNVGVDFQVKFEMKYGRLLHLKLNRLRDRSEILNVKRTLYYMNHNGLVEIRKPESYHMNYCTKYVQHILGVKYCASLTLPHVYNEAGKPKIPFVRALEGSIKVEKTDPSMEGYEVLLELPDSEATEERAYKLLLDTPNSATNRKISTEFILKRPNDETCSMTLKVYSPFYSLDANAYVVNRIDVLQLKLDAVGDQKREYMLLLDVAKDVKGARLVEYQPKIALTLPNTRPIDMTGKIVFAKGRREQITIEMQSNSFDSPFTVKGNLVKEGEVNGLDSNWKLLYDFNINAFSQIHRFHNSIGNQAGNGIFLDMAHHYEPDGRSYESVTVSAKLENIEIRDRLKFSLDAKILLAEHQDLNTMLKWDLNFKPLRNLNSDIIFRYGENFEDDTHLVRFIVDHALHGDFDSFQKMDIQNKVALTISCFNFDKSAALTAVWDLVDQPKFIVEAGVKSEKGKELKFDLNYNHLSTKPLKLATEMSVIYNDYKFRYRDQAQEVSPGEYQGKVIIEPREGKQVTIDYTYRVKSKENFHHELDATINFPGMSVPVQQKALLSFTTENLHFNSFTDIGSQSPYVIDVKLQKNGVNELTLSTPYIEGNVNVDATIPVNTVRADFKTKGRDDRRVVMSGSIAPGDINTLDLDILWDADKDSKKRVTLKAKTHREAEDGIEKHMLTASINYVGSINVDVTGKVSTDFIRGPHYFKADFSGNMEPMAVEYSHEIKDGHMNSVARYLRNGVEKIRTDLKGKYIQRYNHFEIEGGLSLSSPYKTFDGKELYGRVMGDSSETARTFIAEYRIKPAAIIGYVGKFDYVRKRGWPGNVRSNLLVTVHQRPIYEGSTNIDYGNGKYSWKTSFTPISKRKIQFLSSFEHAARFAAFHHSMAASLQYLQSVEINAVADIRNVEDAKLQAKAHINDHKLYDVNTTLKMRSMIDFDGQIVIFSKITPSLHVFSKAQTSGQITKYEMNLDVDSKSLITGSGELKKRKKGFNGEIVFKYIEKEILVFNIQQEAKGKHERNYLIKAKTPFRTYTSNIRVNKEKKGSVKYDTTFCRNERESCVNIGVAHKEYDDTNEWQISYKRGNVDFNIERIRVFTNDLSRFHTVVYNGDKRYGYDLRIGKEGNSRSVSLGIILPSREIITKGTFELSLKHPKVKLELSADGRNHPDRVLITDIKFENHLRDDNPSELDITISHPILEKPIDIQMIGDYKSSSPKFFDAKIIVDYTDNPEDKLIGKLSVERRGSGTAALLINLYHKDEGNLDFIIKANTTQNPNENSFAIEYNWKDENGADAEAYMIANYPVSDRQFYFVYHRPKLHYRLDGKIAPQTLLEDTYEVELTSEYNGETTKGKLIRNYEKGCYKLSIFNAEGEVTRTIEFCSNLRSRKLVSLVTESFDDEGQWTFDFSSEIVQKSWNTIGIRQYANPEFVGKFLFQLTSLADELESEGIGKLPFYNSPQFKKVQSTFISKVLKPAKEFIGPESQKFAKDMRDDFTYLGEKLGDYYNNLPPLSAVKEKMQSVVEVLRHICYEIWTHIRSYYESYIRNVLQFVDKVRETVQEKCDSSHECRSFLNAYNENGWRGLLTQIKSFLLSLPGKIQHYLENPSEEARNFFKKAVHILKAILQPLTKYRCGEIVVKVAQLSYEALEPHVQTFISRLPEYYRRAKEELSSNPYIVKLLRLGKQAALKIQEELRQVDYEKLILLARKYLEDYVSTLSPPAAKRLFTINKIDGERGIVDLDLHTNVLNRIIGRITSIINRLTRRTLQDSHRYNWNTLLVKFKRGLDLNFFPPYEAQAMIVGHRHFVTFDKVFYDFEGECSYLLSRDFEDGNFTLALKPKEGDQAPSVLVIIKEDSIGLNSGVKSVKVRDTTVELPFQTPDVSVTREGSTLIVDDRHGVQVKCNLVHEICTFSISGWYYGKTAGLLGTYNYEPHDEFKRPKGQIANSANILAKSWELTKSCKTVNLIPDVQINKNSETYKLCKSHFESSSSPLAACFSEVEPAEYLQLCLRHLTMERDAKKSLCNVAAAYVMECERNYVELNLPTKCLTCDAPDGTSLQHGDRKKYENLNKKSADVVFIVEDHSCNKVILNDLNNLARSIDRELQNEGFKDTMFGIIGYGGDIGKPQIHTAKDRIFFNSRDINTVTERIKMANQNKTDASTALDAMKLAVTYLFRSETAKSFVLLSCSPCKYDYTSLQYPVIQQILLERGISLHVIHNAEISVRKSTSKEKDIIGVDPDTVYHTKDVTQKDLVGEPDLRSQVSLPKDLCLALSQDVGGSFFSTYPLNKASSNEVKNWRSVFARKFLKAIQLHQCQWCDCTSTRDHIPNTVCQPCEIKRPRLPFSVGRPNVLSRTAEAFLSYILHIISS